MVCADVCAGTLGDKVWLDLLSGDPGLHFRHSSALLEAPLLSFALAFGFGRLKGDTGLIFFCFDPVPFSCRLIQSFLEFTYLSLKASRSIVVFFFDCGNFLEI